MQELVRSTDLALIAHVTALCAGDDIDCFVWDVHMSILEGSLGILPQRVMVADRDLFRARAILRDHGLVPSGPR